MNRQEFLSEHLGYGDKLLTCVTRARHLQMAVLLQPKEIGIVYHSCGQNDVAVTRIPYDAESFALVNQAVDQQANRLRAIWLPKYQALAEQLDQSIFKFDLEEKSDYVAFRCTDERALRTVGPETYFIISCYWNAESFNEVVELASKLMYADAANEYDAVIKAAVEKNRRDA